MLYSLVANLYQTMMSNKKQVWLVFMAVLAALAALPLFVIRPQGIYEGPLIHFYSSGGLLVREWPKLSPAPTYRTSCRFLPFPSLLPAVCIACIACIALQQRIVLGAFFLPGQLGDPTACDYSSFFSDV
jgi:hypothetical protein